MKYRYVLKPEWIERISAFEEFANGATQVSIKTKGGQVFHEILVSNGMYVVAMRNRDDLPFSLSDIADIFQTEEDKNPKRRGGWQFWDTWNK
jgi:hypothetical protein